MIVWLLGKLGLSAIPAWLIELVLVIALVLGARWYWIDEGVHRQQAADAVSMAAYQKAIDKITSANMAAAINAKQEAANARKALADYVSRYPLPAIRLCINPHSRQIATPETSPARPGSNDTGSGSAPRVQVPSGSPSESPDVSPELGTIMQGFAQLAIEVSKWQRRAGVIR